MEEPSSKQTMLAERVQVYDSLCIHVCARVCECVVGGVRWERVGGYVYVYVYVCV